MTVSFNNTPQNLRVPLFYAEVDGSQAGYFTQSLRTLIIAQKLATGSAVANKLELVSRTDDAKVLGGLGSMAAKMHEFYRKNDEFGEVQMVFLDDPAAGTQAAWTYTFTNNATEAGTLNLYIGSQKVQVAVASGDTPAVVASAVNAAINADTSLPVTSSVAAGVVTVTARHKGLVGNDIKSQLNYRGRAGGEKTPAGVTCVIEQTVVATGTPNLAAALAALGDEEFDFIIHPYTDSTSLDAFKALMSDTNGRWAWNRQIYGHVYTAKSDTLSNLVALGVARNDNHVTIAGYEAGVPNPVYEYAAAYGARNAVFIAADPARPTQTGELIGILPAPSGSRFILTERSTLLNSGIATSYYGGSAVRVERAITTYQKNAFNVTDPAFLDSETLHTLAYVIRRLRSVITTKYSRHKLGDDGQRFGQGQAIVTPAVIRGEILSEYAAMEELGIVENAKAFNKYLIVERAADDPNRINVLYPPDLVNQLRVLAVLAQFRLQYSANA